ncbi:MAG: M28 family peptidase [candidate division Zixibacteria bacterium]|nr:M28 family peptidase [candidate division Zixibacteria bacterium]
MYNMDMIGHWENDTDALLFHGDNDQFTQAWIDIGGPLVNLTGHLAGQAPASDHHSFNQAGYDGVFLREYIFSYAWHASFDVSDNIGFDYCTRMTKATLATVYAIAVDDDFDGDGILNSDDNCFLAANSDQQDNDLDLVGDVCDNCPDVYNPQQSDSGGDGVGNACEYICGDANSDQAANVIDAVYIINYVFVGGDPPDPLESADVNCDSAVNVSDVVWIVNYIFIGGNAPCDIDGDLEPDC